PVSVGEPWQWDTAGKGGLILWPLFGATNQLLGGLAFMVIAFWMWRRGLPVWFVVVPMIFMLFLPAVAMSLNLFGENGYLARSIETGNWTLSIFGLATMGLEIWMIIEAIVAWPKARGELETQLSPLPTDSKPNDSERSY
ncbi:MAG TPA: carbon starvation protein A, partial [Opitutae bacterium]|nr:carbon starvation protein A [Opitutae bacterium]